MKKSRKEISREEGSRRALSFVTGLIEAMKIDATARLNEDADEITIVIEGKDSSALIGYRGETLDAVQYLTLLVANKGEFGFVRVVVDCENYREKREETLISLAHKLEEKACRLGRNVTLEAMNPYERRIIHSALQNDKYVSTHSEGDEPFRRVVVTLKK